ncbi:MAG: uracil-xanthine permease [Acholeplasmataceae bacterium]|jgi:uracil permease|nr:uracil-xanthine permease [Acholeplasmataceae bacterium]
MVLNVNEKPKKFSHLLLFSVQHFLAMIVACITVPIIVNATLSPQGIINPLPIDATIVSAGVGTLFYLIVTKAKSPVFLSSSFAYISAIISALSLGVATAVVGEQQIFIGAPNLWALVIGMGIVGLVYTIVAIIIKFTGTAWVRKLLAPVVIGPVIMVIGIGLATSAVKNVTGEVSGSYNLIAVAVGLFTMFVTAYASHYSKKTGKLIPFIIGLGSGYILAAIFTGIGHLAKTDELIIINFSPLVKLFQEEIALTTFFKIPDFLFLRETGWDGFNARQLASILLIFLPVSFVTMSEHIGDHENLGNIIGKDLIVDPGLSRTLIGDGVASTFGGVLSGAANTTYGENVAVIGITKIASIWVIAGAAVFSILVGFFVPFTKFIETIPATVVGGVSLLLYGFIAASGLKILIRDKVDLNENRNIFIVSAILISGIGGLVLQFISQIKIEPIAVAMILGVVLNLTLKEPTPEKKK